MRNPIPFLSPPSLWLLLWLLACPALAQEADISDQVQALDARSFRDKAAAVTALAATGDPRVMPILEALLEGDLYTRDSDGRVVYAPRVDGGRQLTDAVTGEDLGVVGRRDAGRITVNNQLRTQIRNILAGLSLSDPDPAARLTAVRQLLDDFDADTAALFNRALETEADPAIREALESGLALGGLNDPDPAVRREAAAQLAGNINPEVRARLNQVLGDEQDTTVRDTIQASLAAIESRLETYRLMETVFFGLSLGSVLLLAAIGLAITFGVMGVINMAHGELIMLGAYTTYVIQRAFPEFIDISLFLAIPAAFVVSGLMGIVIERGVIRFLYGRPLETLLATFGVSLILQQLVRSLFTAQNRPVSNPDWMSGSWELNAALSLTFNRVYILIFSLMVFGVLVLILKRTSLGLRVRAVTQNRDMAKGVGIRTEWVDAMTFGLGAGIAGVAGVALSQLTNVGPNLGQGYIIDSFLVVVFGGVGNLWGTLVGAMTLGVVNKFLEPVSGAVLAKILVLIFIILFIQKRPNGLFPQRGRAAEA